MLQKAHRIDKVYSEIESDHLAWAARKSFYIDLFCCCLNSSEGCGNIWKYWLQGVVSQIATVYIHFNQKCRIESLPTKPPRVILGLWHFSFTKNFKTAKKHLESALQKKGSGCPIRDIAIIMALHMIHTSREEEHLTAKFIRQQYLGDRKWIDYRLPHYKTIYEQVVIPFLYELGKGTIAKQIEEELKQPPPKPDTTPVSYECELFYWHHNTSYTNFLCLTL